MRILITGGGGKLASVLKPLLVAGGCQVDAPDRNELDCTNLKATRDYIARGYDLVLANACPTQVNKIETNLDLSYSIIQIAKNTLIGCALAKEQPKCVLFSSDYVSKSTPGCPTQIGEMPTAQSLPNVYARKKLACEKLALMTEGASIIRMSFLPECDLATYRWFNDVTIANRLFMKDAASRLASYILRTENPFPNKHYHLCGTEPTTIARMAWNAGINIYDGKKGFYVVTSEEALWSHLHYKVPASVELVPSPEFL